MSWTFLNRRVFETFRRKYLFRMRYLLKMFMENV